MNQPINPARLTTSQAGRIFGPILSELLREPDLPPEFAELAIKLHGERMTREILAVVYKYVHAFKDMKVCSVEVDRTRKLEDYIKRLNGHVTAETDPKVLAGMPTSSSDPVDLYYFGLNDYMGPYSVEEAGNKLALRGIKADPLAHLAFVVARPYLWQGRGSTTSIWQDMHGHWCNLTIRAYPANAGDGYYFPEVVVFREGDPKHRYTSHCCYSQLYVGVRA